MKVTRLNPDGTKDTWDADCADNLAYMFPRLTPTAEDIQREIAAEIAKARQRLADRGIQVSLVARGKSEQNVRQPLRYDREAGPPRPPLAYFHPVEAMIERLADQHDKYGLFLPDPSKPVVVPTLTSRLKGFLNAQIRVGPFLFWFIIFHVLFRAAIALISHWQ